MDMIIQDQQDDDSEDEASILRHEEAKRQQRIMSEKSPMEGEDDDDDYGQQQFDYDSEDDVNNRNPYGDEDEEVNDIIVNEVSSPADLMKQRELLYKSEHTGQSSGISDNTQQQRFAGQTKKNQKLSEDIDQLSDDQ